MGAHCGSSSQTGPVWNEGELNVDSALGGLSGSLWHRCVWPGWTVTSLRRSTNAELWKILFSDGIHCRFVHTLWPDTNNLLLIVYSRENNWWAMMFICTKRRTKTVRYHRLAVCNRFFKTLKSYNLGTNGQSSTKMHSLTCMWLWVCDFCVMSYKLVKMATLWQTS